MNAYAESEIRDLRPDEIDLVSGGGNPTPTTTLEGVYGGHDVYQVSCPYGWGIQGTQWGQSVNPVAGNAYSGFSCGAGAPTEYAYAWQGSGLWNVDATMTWG